MPPHDLIAETPYWKIILMEDQYYLGRCVIVAKRDVGDMADLTDEEWTDFHQVVKKLQLACTKVLNATMFNWTCLMNNAYQNTPPDPHVHWHFRPRYAKPVEFAGMTFTDKEFGYHYERGTNSKVPDNVFTQIVKEIALEYDK